MFSPDRFRTQSVERSDAREAPSPSVDHGRSASERLSAGRVSFQLPEEGSLLDDPDETAPDDLGNPDATPFHDASRRLRSKLPPDLRGQERIYVFFEIFRRLCLRCPPQFGEARGILIYSLGKEIATIHSFFEDVAVFVLSRMWFDTISGYLLRLHPVSYCGRYLAVKCATEATFQAQITFALAAVPVTALLKHLVEWSGMTSRPGFAQVPMMLKYIVGWAFAFAVEALLAEWKATYDLCAPPAEEGGAPICLWVDMGFVSTLTVFSGLVLVVIRPWAKEIEWGDGTCVDWFEDLVEDLWAMVARGLSVMVMALWYDTAYGFVTYGDNGAHDGRKEKLLFLWAVAITEAGALIAAGLEQMEIDLKQRSALLAQGKRDLRAECALTYSDLLQDTLSWVAGCAWVDVILASFASLSDPTPTFETLASNCVTSALVAALAVAWFVVTGQAGDGGTGAIEASRETVERYFVSNSFAFFVGWVWLVTGRNAFAQVERVSEEAMELGIAAMGWHVRPALGDYLVALLWAPAFTFVVFWAQNRAVAAIAAAHGGVDIGAAVHAHSRKQDERESKQDKQNISVVSPGFDHHVAAAAAAAAAPRRTSWRLAKRAVEVRALMPDDRPPPPPPATDAAQGQGSRLFHASRQARQQELLLC